MLNKFAVSLLWKFAPYAVMVICVGLGLHEVLGWKTERNQARVLVQEKQHRIDALKQQIKDTADAQKRLAAQQADALKRVMDTIALREQERRSTQQRLDEAILRNVEDQQLIKRLKDDRSKTDFTLAERKRLVFLLGDKLKKQRQLHVRDNIHRTELQSAAASRDAAYQRALEYIQTLEQSGAKTHEAYLRAYELIQGLCNLRSITCVRREG